MAQQLARFPQRCLRADRRSVYNAVMDARTLEEALRFEYDAALHPLLHEASKGIRHDVGTKYRLNEWELMQYHTCLSCRGYFECFEQNSMQDFVSKKFLSQYSSRLFAEFLFFLSFCRILNRTGKSLVFFFLGSPPPIAR